MLKHPVHEPEPPLFGLDTVTFRAPWGADGSTVMLAVTWVASVKVVELTVMPAPENDAWEPVVGVPPATKLVPVMTMSVVVALEVGVTVGPALTVKHPVQVPAPPSGLVTVTLRAPGAADGSMARLIVTCVELA